MEDSFTQDKRICLSNPYDFDRNLQCPVCKEIPLGKVSQCQNGHLICDLCLVKVLSSSRPLCPECRADLRIASTRNLLAENLIRLISVPCPHANCAEMLTASTLILHRDQQCPFRSVACGFNILGCQAGDIPFNEVTKHEMEQCMHRVDDSALALMRVVVDENTVKFSKLREDLDKMTDDYDSVRRECLQAQEQYKLAKAILALEKKILAHYIYCSDAKDVSYQNVYFSQGVAIPTTGSRRNIAYASTKVYAFGCTWLARLVLVLKDGPTTDFAPPTKLAESLHVSLAVTSKYSNQLQSLIIRLTNLWSEQEPLQLTFIPTFEVGGNGNLWAAPPANDNVGHLITGLPKYDVENGTIPWESKEKKYGRFWTISKNNWTEQERQNVFSLWRDPVLIPAVRLLFINRSPCMKASSKFSCRKSKKFSND